MTGMELLTGMGNISEEMIAETMEYGRTDGKKHTRFANNKGIGRVATFFRKNGWRPAAAVVFSVLIIAGLYTAGKSLFRLKPGMFTDGPGDVVYVSSGGAAVTEELEERMVEDYPVNGEACYVTPKNGTINQSMPLRKAREYYGDSVLYHVIVDVFHDEQSVPVDSEESAMICQTLRELGFAGYLETVSYEDAGETTYTFLTLQISDEELMNFEETIQDSSLKDYGFMFFLYREHVRESMLPVSRQLVGSSLSEVLPSEEVSSPTETEILSGEDVPTVYEGNPYPESVTDEDIAAAGEDVGQIYCGSYLDSLGTITVLLTEDTPEYEALVCEELGLDPAQVTFGEATYTLQYLTDLYEQISSAMVNHELPFVYGCGVYEMENRVILDVSTDDDTMLEEVRRLDTIGGALVFRVGQQATAE